MPVFSPSALLSILETRIAQPLPADFCVAFSGGLDSAVLLHALARVTKERSGYRLRAIHVDHQLHPDSSLWADQCERSARALDVPFLRLRVAITGIADVGLEAAARDARYDALRGVVQREEVLLTAHHADDQLETMLLALLRGSGLRGLGAMPALQAFGQGFLARPLLEFTRDELQDWATGERLSWISDPSNNDAGLDRNYLRHRVAPLLRERWPASSHTATRSAEHLTEAGRLLDALAAADLSAAAVGRCLRVVQLKTLDPPRRRNLLRWWIRQCGARSPSTSQLAAIEHDMLRAAVDRQPCIDWDGWEVRRHRGLLYCEARQRPLDTRQTVEWPAGGQVELPSELGRLQMIAAPADDMVRDMADRAAGRIAASGISFPLHVRFRSGGESLRPAGDAHHRTLKQLSQAFGILPWWRDRLPLIYSGERLLAVGDLWVAEEFAARGAEKALRIVWEDRPPLFAGTEDERRPRL